MPYLGNTQVRNKESFSQALYHEVVAQAPHARSRQGAIEPGCSLDDPGVVLDAWNWFADSKIGSLLHLSHREVVKIEAHQTDAGLVQANSITVKLDTEQARMAHLLDDYFHHHATEPSTADLIHEACGSSDMAMVKFLVEADADGVGEREVKAVYNYRNVAGGKEALAAVVGLVGGATMTIDVLMLRKELAELRASRGPYQTELNSIDDDFDRGAQLELLISEIDGKIQKKRS